MIALLDRVATRTAAARARAQSEPIRPACENFGGKKTLGGNMIKAFPKDRLEKRKMLLDGVDRLAETLRASGPKSEELGTLAPEAVTALRENGMFRLKLCAEMGGAEADPVDGNAGAGRPRLQRSDQRLVHHGRRHRHCVARNISHPDPGLDRVFANGHIPTASISFFPAGRAVRDGKNFRLNGRWRFNSGIQHSEWVVGGTIVEGSEAENGGRPIVMFSAFPKCAGHAVRQLARRRRLARHRVVRLLGRKSRAAGRTDVHLGFVAAEAAARRRRRSCFRRSPMSPRSTAASRSAAPGARSTS